MENIIDKNLITQDEMNLLNILRSSVGGPYLALLSNEQKTVFEVLINALRGHGQYSDRAH